jgi:hypothetical protein
MLDAGLFEWFPVSRALNAGDDGPEVATHIDPAMSQIA